MLLFWIARAVIWVAQAGCQLLDLSPYFFFVNEDFINSPDRSDILFLAFSARKRYSG